MASQDSWSFNVLLYKELRLSLQEVLQRYPDTLRQIIEKRPSLPLRGRRSLERIQTFEALLDELERQLLITPGIGEISNLQTIIYSVCPYSLRNQISELMEDFRRQVRPQVPTIPSSRPKPPQTLSLNAWASSSSASPSQSSASSSVHSSTSVYASTSSRGYKHRSTSLNTSQAITIPSQISRARRISTPSTPTTPTMSTWATASHPSLAASSSPLQGSSPARRWGGVGPSGTDRAVPDHIIDMIAQRFDLMGGSDWRIFVEGLGINLSEYESVRLLSGEVERLERDYPSLRDRLRELFHRFQSRLSSTGVDADIIEVIVDTLRSNTIWGEPVFNRLAREINEAMKKS